MTNSKYGTKSKVSLKRAWSQIKSDFICMAQFPNHKFVSDQWWTTSHPTDYSNWGITAVPMLIAVSMAMVYPIMC